jgi:hypothetical protein
VFSGQAAKSAEWPWTTTGSLSSERGRHLGRATKPLGTASLRVGADFASLSGSSVHEAIFGAQRSVAIDPERKPFSLETNVGAKALNADAAANSLLR